MTRAVCILSLMHTPSEQFYTDAERSACLASSTGETLDTSKSKVKIMEIPKETKAAVKPALWGAAAGAIALAIVGFNWGGWVTGGTAETIAKNRAATAVVAVLAPICVEKFRQAAGASANLAEMKKAGSLKKAVGQRCREAPSQTRRLQGLVLKRSVARRL